MRTRTLATTALAATALLATGTVAAVAGTHSAPSLSSSRISTVKETFTGLATQDVGKKGTSIGDHLSFRTVLMAGSTKKGIGGGDCVVIRGTTEETALYHCTETYRLNGDMLLSGGMFTFAQKTNKWAIMGGTGAYRSASGEISFTTLDANSFQDTFHFDS